MFKVVQSFQNGSKFPRAPSTQSFSSLDAPKGLKLFSKDSLFNSPSFETKLSLFGVIQGAQDAFARQSLAKSRKSPKFPVVQF
jgi:hypothetical protein